LQQVHAIQTKSLDLDERLRLSELRLGDVGDVEVLDWAFAIFDIFAKLANSAFQSTIMSVHTYCAHRVAHCNSRWGWLAAENEDE